MDNKLRRGLMALLAAVFALNTSLVGWQLLNYHLSAQSYDTAVQLATQQIMEETSSEALYPELTSEPIKVNNIEEAAEPSEEPAELSPEPVPMAPEPETEPEPEPVAEEPPPKPLSKEVRVLSQLDLDALRKTNDNVLGWIYIPDSSVNYPLMTYSDNEYGLHHAWDGSENSAGSIFLECKNSRDFSDFNTLIYGHNNRNGTMFSELVNYSDEEYLNSHRSVYIVTDDWVRRYVVFSVYEADVVSDTYRLYFEDDGRKQTSLDLYTSSTDIKTGIIPTVDDHILTLSTCMNYVTNGTRWVVQTVLAEEFAK